MLSRPYISYFRSGLQIKLSRHRPLSIPHQKSNKADIRAIDHQSEDGIVDLANGQDPMAIFLNQSCDRNQQTNITLSSAQPYSATWVGPLNPPVPQTAGKIKIDGKDLLVLTYIRLQMVKDKAKAILDMTGLQDVNGSTTQIIKRSIRQGNPRWTWDSTD